MAKQICVENFFTMTGTIGDTLGGITTFLLSGLTLYYIISTFIDQKSINEHSRSANNFGICYNLLDKIEKKYCRFNVFGKIRLNIYRYF